jgi:formylglycine-generating enzyme required for sulfatase activity
MEGNTGLDYNHAVYSCSGTEVVGSKPSGVSPYGALDIIGNVYELVEDDYHSTYNSAPSDGKAWVDTPRGTYRVLRGGSIYVNSNYLRSSFRFINNPAIRSSTYGFRCSQDLPVGRLKTAVVRQNTITTMKVSVPR